MKLPLLLPKELKFTGLAKDSDNLMEMLTSIPQDMILFFEAASDDQSWTFSHKEFMEKAIHWLTKKSFDDRLSRNFMLRVAVAIQKHYQNLSPYIEKNIAFEVEGDIISVNSLMWQSGSEQLHNLIREHFRNNKESVLALDKFSLKVFHLIDEYIETGSVAKLWQFEKHEVTEVLKRASEWDLFTLKQMCEEVLERYIEKDNVIDTLILGHEENWIHLKNKCIDFINELSLGVQFKVGEADEISLVFNDFRDRALSVFEAIHAYITQLSVSGSLGGEDKFNQIISRCPKLRSLNLSESKEFYENYLNLPENLEELEISKCPWLDQDTIKVLIDTCPDLRKLNLANNYHLEYGAYSELIRLKQLSKLNISYSHQIDDVLLDMILKAVPRLMHLIMDDCRGVGEAGLFDLGRTSPHMTDLSLSQCRTTDASLIELVTRCPNLLHLNLSRCRELTESGIATCIQHAPKLQSIDISHCRISRAQVEGVKERYPFLSISF